MTITATEAALEVLRYWAAQATAPPDQATEAAEPVRRSAWLAAGQPPGTAMPRLDLASPLESIFNRVEPARQPVYLRRGSLALTEPLLFPVATPQQALATGENPAQALAEEVTAIEGRDLPDEARVEALLYALQRHAWRLPSPLAAVSLHDFARTSAAIAAALAIHDGDLFLLGGDLSGVQRFIYTLTAAGATKQLRGRSFYLQLLTEAAAHYLLTRAGLPATNLIYSGGGRFYALLPAQIDGEPVGDWLTGQRVSLDRFFLYRHQSDLHLALGGGVVQQDDLRDTQRFRKAWRNATEEINRAKRRRFGDLGAELVKVFEPQGRGGDMASACVVCGYQGDPAELTLDRDDPTVRRCLLCNSFEELGRLLHNASWLLLHHLEHPATYPQEGRRPWQALLGELGIHVQIKGKHARPGERGNEPPAWPVRWTTALALDLDDAALADRLRSTDRTVYGLRPLANTTPTMHQRDFDAWKKVAQEGERAPEEGDVKPFSVMVEQSRGIKRLGVLRMDVDDLGVLFGHKFESGLARTSALSGALALFFEGWVGHLCDATNATAGQGSVYCIYSGGDDLFIVGSWHLLPALARQISDDLARYTGQHPAVHVSAGISLHPAKFPLYQAAETAKEELEQAKRRIERDGTLRKAALGWLNQVVGWEYAPGLFDLVTTLDGYFQKQPGDTEPRAPDQDLETNSYFQKPPRLSRALLQTLQALYVQYTDDLEEMRRKGRAQFYYGPWTWRRMYQLTRVAEQASDDATKAWVKELRDSLLQGIDAPPNTGGRMIERAGLAARWAQLLIRKEQRNGHGQ